MRIQTGKTYTITGLQLSWFLDHLTSEQIYNIDVSELGDADLLITENQKLRKGLNAIKNTTKDSGLKRCIDTLL